MDDYVVRVKVPTDLPCGHQLLVSSVSAPRLSRKIPLLASYEIHGRVLPSYKRSLLKLMVGSYSEIGSFPQSYSINDTPGPLTRVLRTAQGAAVYYRSSRQYVSCIDFDSKGIYLASTSNTGCLSIHEFETLYCNASKGSRSHEDGASFIRYISTDKPMQAVRWNPGNQDEVACVAAGSDKVYFYDVACDSFLPSEVLRVKSTEEIAGLHDLVMCKHGVSRVLACGKNGNVHIWDRRASRSSYAALPVEGWAGALNTLQLSNDEQVVYAGSEGGFIHAWDLRGGKRSAAFVTCGEVYHEPFGAVKVATLLSEISSLRAQTQIGSSAVHAISVDSSCGHRLAFHLNNGWSGVLDMITMSVTHLHCPPPPWMDGLVERFQRRRPVWVSSYSVYAVGSASEAQVHMLDFTCGPKSRCSVDHECSDDSDLSAEKWQADLHTLEPVVAVAAHPLNDQLVAGTEGRKLLLLGQKKTSVMQEAMDT